MSILMLYTDTAFHMQLVNIHRLENRCDYHTVVR